MKSGTIKATLIIQLNGIEITTESVEMPFKNGSEFYCEKRIKPFLNPFLEEKNAKAEQERLETIQQEIATVLNTPHSSQE